MIYTNRHRISFGDCDPAGIVFYPNYFALMDRTFHGFLAERAGGHALLCADLGATGFGLMGTEMKFKSPAREGDLLDFVLTAIEWSKRSFTVSYLARIGERIVLEASETRGMFVEIGGRLTLGEAAPLQQRLAAEAAPE